MKPRNLFESFNCAIEGFIYVIKTQRNMRLHFLLAILVITASLFMHFDAIEMLILIFTVALVLVCEMLNTAVEFLVDMITDAYHPLARIVKDICAGAVLISATAAIVVGYVLALRHGEPQLDILINRIRYSSWHFTAMSLGAVFFAVIVGKVLLHKGRPLRGGMPSGHTALAFSIWTLTILLTGVEHPVVSVLVLILALAVARSRIRLGVHTGTEVVSGAFVGIFVTVLIYQIFY
jgi:diacylglycerol kinase (ATP)